VVGGGDVLGRAIPEVDVGEAAVQLLPHGGHRLDGDHLGAPLEQGLGGDPGAGGEVNDLGAPGDPQLGAQEVDRFPRVTGAVGGVVGGPGLEALGGGVLDRQSPSLDPGQRSSP
jgi:hypothetical protein